MRFSNKHILAIGTVALMGVMVGGCVEENTASTTGNTTGNTTSSGVMVVSTSNASVALDGMYDTGCYSDGSNGHQETLAVATDPITFVTGISYSRKIWPGDPACSSVVGSTDMAGIIQEMTDTTAKGWIDVAGSSTTAPNSNLGPVLSLTPAYTNLALTVVSGGSDFNLGAGDLGTFSFVVDDSDVATVGLTLYRIVKRASAPGSDARAIPFNQVP